jgi:hypothetical protein
MSHLKLVVATTDYDHFRDFRLGLVRAEGIDHNWLALGHHELYLRKRTLGASREMSALCQTRTSRS